jgi:hypothetical protein
MTKVEWLAAELSKAGRGNEDFWKEGSGDLLRFVQQAGEGLSRRDFWREFHRLFQNGIGPGGPSGDWLDASWHFYNKADFSQVWDTEPFEPLPRVENSVLRAALGENDFIRVGGSPEWLQSANTPPCPRCERDMGLIAEIRSLPEDISSKHPGLETFMFADCGRFYVFHCKACGTSDVKLQFH